MKNNNNNKNKNENREELRKRASADNSPKLAGLWCSMNGLVIAITTNNNNNKASIFENWQGFCVGVNSSVIVTKTTTNNDNESNNNNNNNSLQLTPTDSNYLIQTYLSCSKQFSNRLGSSTRNRNFFNNSCTVDN